jgi:Rrf2 family nitric oxide-sensitive transcriptional repressor
MRLTRFTNYSLHVLIYLGQNNEGRITIQQISDAYEISKNHLMKVVSNLTRLKIVAAQRGPGGGIQLNRLPEDISLYEVVSNSEKHLQGLAGAPLIANGGQLTAEVHLSSYINQALEAYLDTLKRFTLADVLEPQAEIIQLLEMKEISA